MTQVRGIWPSFTLPYLTKVARRWAPSGLTFGAAGFLALTFFTDWKDLLIHVPVLNYRFTKNDEKK